MDEVALRQEVLRYMGYKPNSQPDGQTDALVTSCIADLRAASSYAHTLLRLPLQIEEDTVALGGVSIQSSTLAAHLAGCKEVLLFAATLGAGADRLLMRASKTQVSAAVVLQAAAAALLEAAVDKTVETLAEAYRREGLHLLQRYSPGYGDCPLTCQQNLLRLLDAGRRIGLTCTNGNMLTPTKSITAFIGLSPATGGNNPDGGCKANRCAVCNLTDCPYRRSDV